MRVYLRGNNLDGTQIVGDRFNHHTTLRNQNITV